MDMGRWMQVVVIATLLVFLVPRIIYFVQFVKFGKTVYNHEPGPCENIKGIQHGAEDMQAMADGKVLITSGLTFLADTTQPHWNDVKGQILLFDPKKPKKGAVPLTIQGDGLDLKTFNPHGISLWEEKGVVSVYTVNHGDNDVDTIEVFTFDPKKRSILVHEETIASDVFLLPNDLVVVGRRQFYVTNYQHYRGLLGTIEAMCQLRHGQIVYFDGTAARVVVDELCLPNGINKSPDGRYIYLVHLGNEEVVVFERKPDGGLQQKQVYNTPGALDNVSVDDETGDLWLAGHPVLYLTAKHMQDTALPAPSQVLKLTTKEGLITEATEVYMDDGTRYVSASTVAVKVGDRLLIGTIYTKAVMCQLLYQPTK